ncbi:MAG: GNAT family N-acetyltransferase, partial [Rhizobiales bacterium]|nr:GNAT family N-acetyltransferase [Hyphomicrobiales bacterium]
MQHHAQIDIQVHLDPAELREDWMALQSAGATTLYQTYEWCLAWYNTIGRPNGVQAQIVTGRGADGKIKFILPLAIRQHGSYRIAEWLAAQIATYGLGVYDPSFLAQSALGLTPYWKAIVAALPDADGIWLNHLPETWNGRPHPLSALITTRSANQTHQIALQPNYAELYATKRSANSRRGAQRRDKQLEAVGDVTFGLPASDAEADRLIDEMIKQHARYLAARGVHNVLEDGTADFLKQLTRLTSDSQVSIFPQYLHVDGKLVSTKLGFIFDRVYWAMISSLDAADLHKYSPGDYALRKT